MRVEVEFHEMEGGFTLPYFRPVAGLIVQQGLAALRVVDLSTGIPGGYCCRLLADAGADVVKVEPPGGDPWRAWSAGGARRRPRRPAARCSSSCTTACARWSVVPATRRSRRSSPAADVVIESFAPVDVRRAAVARRAPGLGRLLDHAVRAHRAVRRAAGDRVHRAGRVGRPGRARFGAQRPVPGGRAHQRVAGGHVLGDGGRRGRAARGSAPGHGDHIDFSIAEVMTIAASSYAEYMRAAASGNPPIVGRDAHDRDAVGRADPRRLRRLLHQQPRAVPQLPAAHRPSRSHRRRFVELRRPTGRTRWDEWNDIVHAWTTQHTTAEIVRAGERAAHPGRAGAQRREHPRAATTSSPATSSSTTRRARSRCRAARGAWTTRTRRCRARRRASASTPATIEPHTPARRPSTAGDPRAAARGRARARPHRVVGGARSPPARSPRSAPT